MSLPFRTSGGPSYSTLETSLPMVSSTSDVVWDSAFARVVSLLVSMKGGVKECSTGLLISVLSVLAPSVTAYLCDSSLKIEIRGDGERLVLDTVCNLI